MSCCILSLVTVTGQYKYVILYMREWLSGGASPCQGEGRGFDPRLALLVCPKVVRYLVYRKVVHCVTDHIFVQREVRSTSRTHAEQGFGSPPPEVGLGRFGGKKVHRTFFWVRLTPSRVFVLPKSGPLFSVQEGGTLRNGPHFCAKRGAEHLSNPCGARVRVSPA